ncbi:MAG: hypothetical protein IPM17_15070 [Verrucomicrobia bacterium]|nr:hypothetical protein [Verrucomicrobiota bacterium]
MRPAAAAAVVSVSLMLTDNAGAAEREIETRFLRFRWTEDTGAYAIEDKEGGTVWRSNARQPRFGEVTLRSGGQLERRPLAACRLAFTGDDTLTASFRVGEAPGTGDLRVTVRAGRDGRSLDWSWAADPGLSVESVRLLDDALWVTDAEQGAVLVPVREGILIPADSGRAFTHSFDTYAYEGCHLAMLGVLKQGATALISWSDPYVRAEVTSVLPAAGADPGSQTLAPALILRPSARSFRLAFPGRGDHVTVAQAYRDVARERGWRVTWHDKLRDNPDRARLFGATNFKLWTLLARRMNEESSQEESVRVNWTFDEAAQVAEHLRHDLQLDRVLFGLGGWIHRGYDNQHPDILPTAPECGGDAAFVDCVQRIKRAGYLVSLHDNYQDIYRDSPSWDERLIMKQRDGKLAVGGRWLGGRAYLICSQPALALAKRPENLPAVHRLAGDGPYFIDTTYASGLQECFDPQHPLTRQDDLRWKQELSDYARSVFGMFGSECGREWAIPHADFFEGLAGVSGGYFHDAGLLEKLGGVVVPLFELVYRDCIALYGKYGYDPNRAAAYVLHHLVIGRPLHHHNVPSHLYWRTPPAAPGVLAVAPLPPELDQIGPRTALVSWLWDIQRPPAEDWRVFVHLTDDEGKILRQADHAPQTPTSRWRPGRIQSALTLLDLPAGPDKDYQVRVGLFRESGRAELVGEDDGERRYQVGRLEVRGDRIRWVATPSQRPAIAGGTASFARGDHGWAENLHPYDRFVKNTHEVLSPLHRLTAQTPMTRHRFLTADRAVQESMFGEGEDAVTVTVNFGGSVHHARHPLGGDVALPQFGFLVAGPRFLAFHASTWDGVSYPQPVLFTLRAEDDLPLAQSRAVRVFHGFGDGELRFRGRSVATNNEVILAFD